MKRQKGRPLTGCELRTVYRTLLCPQTKAWNGDTKEEDPSFAGSIFHSLALEQPILTLTSMNFDRGSSGAPTLYAMQHRLQNFALF